MGLAGDERRPPGRDDGSPGWHERLACRRDDPLWRGRGFGGGGGGHPDRGGSRDVGQDSPLGDGQAGGSGGPPLVDIGDSVVVIGRRRSRVGRHDFRLRDGCKATSAD